LSNTPHGLKPYKAVILGHEVNYKPTAYGRYCKIISLQKLKEVKSFFTFIFGIVRSRLCKLDRGEPEEKGTTILRNVVNCLPVDMA
jgi:hypothetical protein